MSLLTTVRNVKISGVSAAVPKLRKNNHELVDVFGPAIEKVIQVVGIEQRRVAKKLCTSDLCASAAETLMSSMGYGSADIDAIIFLSQTPDHLLPATSCLLQQRLGLSTSCPAFDMSLGCSGYVYGLWVASSLISAGQFKNILLLVGDTTSRMVSPKDRSVALLFGDAASATVLTRSEGAVLEFALGTDGAGAANLIVPAGGFRAPWSEERSLRKAMDDGAERAETDIFMNGSEIFTFSMTEVPKLASRLLEYSNTPLHEVDYFVFHQASKIIIDHLRKRMKLPVEKVVNGVRDYGNTSSASIPLALVTELGSKLNGPREVKLMLAAFGVGYSWGALNANFSNVVIPPLCEVPEPDDTDGNI